MHRLIKNSLALFAVFGTVQVHAAIPQNFSVLPAQPVAGEKFQLIVPVNVCGLLGVAGSVRANSRDVDVTIDIRADAICTAVNTPPVPITVNIFGASELAQAGVYRVRISQRPVGQTTGAARNVGFGLVSVLSKDSPQPAAADIGAWMEDPGAAGASALNSQRVHIEQRGQHVVVQLNTFDAQGRESWLQAAGTRQGHIVNGELKLVNGRSPFSAAARDEFQNAYGQMSLEFVSPSRALIWISNSQNAFAFATVPLVIVRQNTDGEARKAFVGRWVLSLEADDAAASAMPAQILSFTNTADASETYVDSAKSQTLRCAAAPSTFALAGSCELVRSGQVEVRFTEIGWNRLRGINSAGKKVSMFRITD